MARGESEPVKYWISNLPADLPPKDLVRLAKARRRIGHDCRELNPEHPNAPPE
ncbi:hypothetical protein [Streptomyces cremeus]|uniref:Uncharacterized protein n=1 Tax=Streptomyces cremeus TaxID=66881 RepID=A0ABV5P5Y1_STRCM